MSHLANLLAQLPHATGVARVDLLNEIAISIYGSDPDQMRRYCDEALQLAQELGYRHGVALSYKNMGVSHWAQADYDTAAEYMETAVSYFLPLNDYGGLARCYNNLGIVNQTQARYITALDYLIKAADYSEKIGDTALLSTIYLNMADIYSLQNSHYKALEFTQRALAVFGQLQDTLHQAGLHGKLGEVYFALGHYEEAHQEMEKAMTLAEQFGSRYHVGRYSINLSRAYNQVGQHEQALQAAENALAAGEAIANKRIISYAHILIGEAHHQLHHAQEARPALLHGLALAQALAARELEAEAHNYLAELGQKQGDFPTALHHYQAHVRLKEELAAEKHGIQVAEMQMRYEVERKEREAEIYRLKTEELAQLVAERTADLAESNERLQWELEEHHRTAVQLIEARDRAEEASHAKSSFLTNMSHELRTPLNAIIGYSELVVEEAREAQHHQYLDDMGRILWSARHLLGIINDVLDLAKIEAGRMEVRLGEFALGEVVKVVTAAARPLVERRNNQLTIMCPPELPPLHSDEQKVRQILLNLLSNAAKFTENGHITLTVAREKTADGRFWLACTVADTGIGMSAAEQTRLFQPFTQLDASPSRLYEGTGLGLTISQHFTHLLGGRIAVHSHTGQGSTFIIHLPWG